ncbi:MAG TPA: hypothetical protein VKK79_03090 [Candidatus Lokiarchaeia archaeon]|nr:hypothetical protein [Candidatus Lokiarchaeia archaeon]
MRCVTIYRWNPQTFRACAKRWITLFDGTAPQAVQDGLTKVKTIALEMSAPSQMIFQIWEVADEDLVDAMPVGIYLQEVFDVETHVVQTTQDWNKAWDKLELFDNVPAPEW